MYEAEAAKIHAQSGHFKGSYVAGGAITSVFTNAPINDIDLYFKTKLAFEEAVLDAYDNGWWCVDLSKRSITFSDNGSIVQMMHFDFFETPADIFKAFDFTVCMAAYDYDAKEFVFHDDFLKHNSQRFLKFNTGTRYPLASATRVLKYQGRGYTIGKGDVLRIVLASRAVPINSWEELQDQIGGAYGSKIMLAANENYSIEAALEALEKETAWDSIKTQDQPRYAEECLKKVAELKGVPFEPEAKVLEYL